jgi:hypothetical protein
MFFYYFPFVISHLSFFIDPSVVCRPMTNEQMVNDKWPILLTAGGAEVTDTDYLRAR